MPDLVQQTLQAVSVDRIRAHIHALEGVRHPIAAPEALDRAAGYIRDMLASFGCEVSEHLFDVEGRSYRNILGLHRGTRFPERRVIVLAHYDTVSTSPGANDNASGVAAVLELARIFQPLDFEASLHFIGVSLEERLWDSAVQASPLYANGRPIATGSRALAAHALASNWDIQGLINFEEIAFASDSIPQKTPPGLPLELPAAGNFIGIIGNEASTDLVQGFVRSIVNNRIALPYVPLVVPGNGELIPDSRRSDHAPFWDLGFKAILLTDTANFRTPHYHRPGDTLGTLNLDFAAQVCRAAGGLVMDMACLAGSRGLSS